MWKKTDNNFDENFYTGIFVVEFCSEKKIFFSLSLTLILLSTNGTWSYLYLTGVILISSIHAFSHTLSCVFVCTFTFHKQQQQQPIWIRVFFLFLLHISHSFCFGRKDFFFFLILKKIQNKSKSKLWRLVFFFFLFFCFTSFDHHCIISTISA